MKKPKADRRSDYVTVRLTTAGEKFASGALRISNRHLDYEFRPGAVQEVVDRYEWSRVLSHMNTPDGLPVFEVVDAVDAKPEPAQSESSQEGVNEDGRV